MSSCVQASRAVRTVDTYSHLDDVSEHQVIEITNTAGVVQSFDVYLDISAITRVNFQLFVYTKVDGTNYRLHESKTFAATDDEASFSLTNTSYAIKVTAKSSVAEGAVRSIPYVYTTERK